MNRLNPIDDAAGRASGLAERLALALARLAMVPLLLVAVLLTGAIYTLAGLAHGVALTPRWARSGLGLAQRCGKAATSSR